MVVNSTYVYLSSVGEYDSRIAPQDASIGSPIHQRPKFVLTGVVRHRVDLVVLDYVEIARRLTNFVSGRQLLVGMVCCPAIFLLDSVWMCGQRFAQSYDEPAL